MARSPFAEPWQQQLHEALSSDLDRVVRRFKPGVKVTLVIRQPHLEGDTGIVIGNDDLDDAIAEIQRRKELDGGA